MTDNSLLQPGETLGTPVSAPAPSQPSSLLQPGETLGAPVSAPQSAPLTEADAASGKFANQQAQQKVRDVAGPPTHIFQNGKIVPIDQAAPTGVVGSLKRNSVDALTGLWHAFNQPATNDEKAALLQKVREANAKGDKVPEELATNPSRATLALHRIVDAPAEELLKKGRDEVGVAQDLLNNHKYWKGGNLYLSGLADKALSGLPLIGPVIGSIASRGEGALVPAIDKKGNDVPVSDVPDDQKDLSGAATDVGALVALEHAPAIVKAGGDTASKVAEVTSKAVGNTASKVSDVASNTAQAIKPEWLTKRGETPAPQHGAPVKVESPLDGPTVGKQLGGKDLSQEALDALKQHVGENIPVGSTAKNRLITAVEPVRQTINDTASKMNKVVQKAPSFTTSVMQDSVFGEGSLHAQFDALKENIPASDRAKLSADADSVLEDADKALNSTDPTEVLEYRRQLGRKIDWDSIEKNPSTPSEVQNAARAKVYQQLTGKIHAEIPDTVELDKTLQPNLELRSHLVRKVGERLVDDPHAATVEAQSELKKGATTVENAAHNEAVQKNWNRVKAALVVAGIGGGLIHEVDKLLGL
jgi:hypothetical protein